MKLSLRLRIRISIILFPKKVRTYLFTQLYILKNVIIYGNPVKAGRAHLVLTLLDDWFGARSKQRRRRPPRHLLVRLRILTEKENPSSGSDPRQGSRGGFGVATRRPAAAGVGRPRFSGNPSPGEGVAGSAAMPWESTKVDPPSSRALFIVVLSLSACQVFSLGVDFWWRSESHPSFELFSPWEIIAILSFFS